MAVSISLSIAQNSQSIANNTSSVTVKVTAKWTYGSYNATGECTGSITIAGTKYSFSGIKFNTGKTTSGSQVIMTKTVNVSHNSDGTKTLSCSASFVTGVSSGTVTASGSKTLTTIARKSTLSVSNGSLGTAQTLTVTRKSTALTHTITYTCGSASGTIASKSSSTSISWTPPWSLAKQNEGGTSVSVKLTITTYSGSTSIGSNSYTISCSVGSNSIVATSEGCSLGESVGITMGIVSNSLVHTVTYQCGTETGTILDKSTAQMYFWTPPWSLALQAPGKTSVSVTLYVKTYIYVSGTYYKVGNTKTKTITCAINSASMTVTSGTLSYEQTFTVTRAGNYWHTVQYRLNGELYNIAARSTAETIKWTPPVSLASQNPSGTSVTIEFLIKTFSTDTINTGKQIGVTRSVSKTYQIPSSVKPSVTLTLSDAEGHLAKYGKYVKGKSKLEFNVDAEGSYGSTIVSKTTTFNGKNYTAESGTIESLPVGDNITVTTTVKDTRGRTATASKTISVYDYANPKVTELVIRRCNENSTPNPAGAYLAIDYDATITALGNNNSAKYTLKYKKVSESTYTVEELTSLENVFVILGASTVIDAETDSAYDISLTVEDDFTSITKKGVGSSVKKVWSMYAKGKGFAFGKIAELLETFEVGWNARFYKDVKIDGKLDAFPVGSVFITDTYTNPSTKLGGTWECFDKNLAYKVYDYSVDSSFFIPTANTSSWYGYATVEGHHVTIRIEIVSAVEAGETEVTWGHFDFVKLGFGSLAYSYAYAIGAGDSLNAVMLTRLEYNDGALKTTDINPKTDGGLLKVGEAFVAIFTVPISTFAMYNANCDKFYWRRTA